MKYKKKPVVIEAVQYKYWDNGKPIFSENLDWVNKAIEDGVIFLGEKGAGYRLFIKTLEGNLVVNNGAFIIKGVRGELYACDQEIFKQTYEEAV